MPCTGTMLSSLFHVLFRWIIAPLAFMVLARFVWQAAFWLYLMTLRRQNWSLYQQRDEQTGRCRSWALVTGATDGIGLGFAKVHILCACAGAVYAHTH
jgi:hypothetical protein